MGTSQVQSMVIIALPRNLIIQNIMLGASLLLLRKKNLWIASVTTNYRGI
jgi:hypothetical protein